MSQYIIMNKKCDICNKVFARAYNLTEHKNKKIPCNQVRSEVCEYCKKKFATVGSLSRHLKNSCPQKIKLDKREEKLKKEEEEFKKEEEQLEKEKRKNKMLITKLMQAKMKRENEKLENQLKKIEDEQSENNINIINNNTINNTINNCPINITFVTKEHIKKNFKNGPCIESLTNYNDIRKGNIITSKNISEDVMFIDTIVCKYGCGKLTQYIGNIIISFYKKENKLIDQSLWCSDISRLTFLVRILPKGSLTTTWISDPSGIIVREKVIQPLLEYISKCIDDRVIINLILDPNSDKHSILTKIVKSIKNYSLSKNVSKYIAPHFAFGQQSITNDYEFEDTISYNSEFKDSTSHDSEGTNSYNSAFKDTTSYNSEFEDSTE